jgi:hypothetical protein
LKAARVEKLGMVIPPSARGEAMILMKPVTSRQIIALIEFAETGGAVLTQGGLVRAVLAAQRLPGQQARYRAILNVLEGKLQSEELSENALFYYYRASADQPLVVVSRGKKSRRSAGVEVNGPEDLLCRAALRESPGATTIDAVMEVWDAARELEGFESDLTEVERRARIL